MNFSSLQQAQLDSTWVRYRENFPRHVIATTRQLESMIMQQLVDEHGFADLHLYFEPYISLIPQDGIRLSEIAATLRVSRQAANQAANQMQAAGYIQRTPDLTDGRAKRITLTRRGKELRREGINVAIRLEAEVAKAAGKSVATRSGAALIEFCEANGLLTAEAPEHMVAKAPVVGLLPRFGNYVSQRLMDLVKDCGHPNLKLSFAHVLTFIGPDGGRIFKMAALQNVSKQAISAISKDLESVGYIYRQPDPEDARQTVLKLTRPGRKLIEDSVDCIDDLEAEIRSCIGTEAFQTLCLCMQNCYRELSPEFSIFQYPAPDIELLARELQQMLSHENLSHLIALLSNPETVG